MKTNNYYTMEQHRDGCYKLNKDKLRDPNVCGGCNLVEEQPIPSLPGYTKKVCRTDKLKGIIEDENQGN